jgi:hypothetical protein
MPVKDDRKPTMPLLLTLAPDDARVRTVVELARDQAPDGDRAPADAEPEAREPDPDQPG